MIKISLWRFVENNLFFLNMAIMTLMSLKIFLFQNFLLLLLLPMSLVLLKSLLTFPFKLIKYFFFFFVFLYFYIFFIFIIFIFFIFIFFSINFFFQKYLIKITFYSVSKTGVKQVERVSTIPIIKKKMLLENGRHHLSDDISRNKLKKKGLDYFEFVYDVYVSSSLMIQNEFLGSFLNALKSIRMMNPLEDLTNNNWFFVASSSVNFLIFFKKFFLPFFFYLFFLFLYFYFIFIFIYFIFIFIYFFLILFIFFFFFILKKRSTK